MTRPERSTFLRLDGSIDSIDVVQNVLADLWLRHPWVSAIDRMAFETALVELVANIVRYALRSESETADLVLIIADTELRAEVIDHGRAFPGDLRKLPMPDPLAESGRGLAVIRSLADVFEYRRDAAQNRWTIARHLTGSTVKP